MKFLWSVACDFGWFFFSSFVLTLLLGRMNPFARGVKILVYQEHRNNSPVLWRGRLSVGNWPERTACIRYKIVNSRWHDDDRLAIAEVAWADRGVTWCFGWEGESADALRAAVAMQ